MNDREILNFLMGKVLTCRLRLTWFLGVVGGGFVYTTKFFTINGVIKPRRFLIGGYRHI